ncbi:HXXXD-type acyl-transferase family protein [Citrus sinensis]|uniref:HXXXD-type acyl-transferase family protein n=1 Tax=Citrus sinensis TaxID=2711 RepID=A0ACB8JKB4_CITSI|nr:HXXXD-type acyl-transferase family protein [Citrus sinensis]
MAVILKAIFRITASKLVTNKIQIFTKRSIKTATSDVQIISIEAIKPSSPTPKQLRAYKLSLPAQLCSKIYIFLVDCNDHGAAFIEANVGCHISKFLQPLDRELLQQLIPPCPQLSNLEISERALLAVQVNLLRSAIFDFMKTWGVIAHCNSLFPPVKFSQQYQIPSPQSSRNIVFKRLLFDGMGNNFDDGLQATGFGVVSALNWGAFIAVARERKRAIDKKLYSYAVYYTMNLHNKMNPPIFITRSGKTKEKGKRCDEYMGRFKVVSFNSAVGLPYYEVDFGWGKPVWFSLGPLSFPELAILTNSSDGEGIEALAVMSKEDMDKFEPETSIMAYASPNPSIIFSLSCFE